MLWLSTFLAAQGRGIHLDTGGSIILYLFFIGPPVLVLIIWVTDVYRHRHPLTDEEVLALAKKRARNRALSEHAYSVQQQIADPEEKKAMKHAGEFITCDQPYYESPARIAGLLKYKKHEWIVFAFASSKRVQRLWWNKGPDGTKVWSNMPESAFRYATQILKPDLVAILHNHPNPNPSLYRANLPSQADLRSASYYDAKFRPKGIILLEFICERGVPHLYYASFPDHIIPVHPIIAEIRLINGSGIFKNYSLRKDLKGRSDAERIAGP